LSLRGKKLKKAIKVPEGMELKITLNEQDYSITLSIEERAKN